jgi:hypothetical protein
VSEHLKSKIALLGPDGVVETVWAADLGDGKFRLDNLPFFAMGLAFGDIVSVEPSTTGFPTVKDVVERSGHSLYRIYLLSGRTQTDFERAWAPIGRLGCSYERATDQLVAVDVPPATDIYEAYRLLDASADAGIWDLQEAFVGHPLSDPDVG